MRDEGRYSEEMLKFSNAIDELEAVDERSFILGKIGSNWSQVEKSAREILNLSGLPLFDLENNFSIQAEKVIEIPPYFIENL